MFSGFMVNTWIAATMVAVIAGVVGFFVVLRGSAFAAHAIPHGSFGGAAGAVLIGANTILGLGIFAVGGALGIGWLSRRGRHDREIARAHRRPPSWARTVELGMPFCNSKISAPIFARYACGLMFYSTFTLCA